MKPPSAIQNSQRDANRRFPITDCNYRSLGFSELKTRCARTPRSSFTTISRDYFNGEARYHFVLETVVFALITVTAIPALFDCGRALREFMRAIGGM
jgi:hypothetical protein